ncbi:Spherulin [Lachnellula occidentalis]|uniref:Spherulin n=1 Tax=Lachnellula occidentalis TaxID=215460 RepID=A0A8H8UK51_9HELO|nr:Spherulin [Lachnellula occidentalis]
MVLPSAILLPLYLYPTATTPWTNLYNSLSAHPNTQFDVVINPDSGPMLVGPSDKSLSDYIAAVSNLSTYPNANIYGYVHTGYGDASLQPALLSNISRYATWNTYEPANIHLDGIFFDETPNAYDASIYTNFQTATNLARSSKLSKVIFNPGTIADAEYFALADYIIMFEGAYADFDASKIAALSQAVRANSSVVIYGSTLTEADQKTFVSQLVDMGLGSFDITTTDSYATWSALWAAFTQQFSSAVGVK